MALENTILSEVVQTLKANITCSLSHTQSPAFGYHVCGNECVEFRELDRSHERGEKRLWGVGRSRSHE